MIGANGLSSSAAVANLKCVIYDGQLFFETLESIPAHSDLIVAQSDHTFNGYILMRAIAGLIIGKLKRKLVLRCQLHKLPIIMPHSVEISRFFCHSFFT